MNIYTIETPGRTYTAHGTEQAYTLIREIQATHALRQKSTAGAVGKSLFNSTTNLVGTPVRVIEGVGDRVDQIGSVEDAILFAPKTVGEVGSSLFNGVGEFAHTGVRIAKGAAGTRCSGVGDCVSEAGRDILSGVNSIAGKHSSARNIHQAMGTDNETRNPVLKREVNRLAYANAYTGATFDLGVPAAGLNYLSTYQRGIGWINNAEFTGRYQDAERGSDLEKAGLSMLGVDQATIDRLYTNRAFTRKDRTALVSALNAIGPTAYSAPFTRDAASANSPHIARNKIEIYKYFAHMTQSGQVENFVSGPTTLAYRPDGTFVMPLKADYLQWTTGSQQQAEFLAMTARNGQKRAELHVLGRASPEVKTNTGRMGVKLVEIR